MNYPFHIYPYERHSPTNTLKEALVADQTHQESRSTLKPILLAVGLALVVAGCVLWPDQAAASW